MEEPVDASSRKVLESAHRALHVWNTDEGLIKGSRDRRHFYNLKSDQKIPQSEFIHTTSVQYAVQHSCTEETSATFAHSTTAYCIFKYILVCGNFICLKSLKSNP